MGALRVASEVVLAWFAGLLAAAIITIAVASATFRFVLEVLL